MNPLFADVRELWRRFVGALVLLSAVGVGAHLVVAAHTEAEREVAALVNLAGRQRMLATRIALQATLAEAAPNETARGVAIADLRGAVDLFETSHARLRADAQADPALLALHASPPAAGLDAQVAGYVALARTLRASDASRDASHLVAALAPLLASLDEAVTLRQRAAEASIDRQLWVERGALGGALLALVLLAAFVVRPLAREVEQAALRNEGHAEETRRDLETSHATVRVLESASAAIEAKRKEEEGVLEARTRFLAMLSHELRTPLNGVVGYLELLGLASPNERQRDLLVGARASARHMLELIDDFLDFAKLADGKLEIGDAPFSLRDTIEQTRAVVARMAEQKGLDLVIELDPSTPDMVGGDALRVRQILVNLLSNAVKFTRAGTIRLRVRADDAGVVEFEVQDEGCGIPSDRLDRIFEPFRQADANVAGNHGGTGLGLSISRRIARALGGELTVVSEEGVGSTFRFHARFGAVGKVTTPTRVSTLAPAAPSRALRVLLADDNAVNRLVGKKLLEALGHRTDVAEDGFVAVTLASVHRYDAIIMDLEMPHLDGVGAAKALRDKGNDVPILGFTAHTDAIYAERCREAGMSAVVHKPLDIEKLSKALVRVVDRGSGRASVARRRPRTRVEHVTAEVALASS